MNRRIILIAILAFAIFFSYDLDPLGIRGKSVIKENPGANPLTGFFAANNSGSGVLIGIFFLMLIGMAFFISQRRREN
ncbi:MAG: hypothetical protein AABX01_00720 [Candidatus Micrarchaeota archaeon]